MKPRVNDDYWDEVEACMKEETPSGYKLAIVEADKILRFILKQNGYPGKDLKQQIFFAGWKLEDKKELEKAVNLRETIINELDYKLSTFEAEDAVKAYRDAIIHFSSKKALGFKKKLSLYYSHYLSLRSSFLQKTLLFILTFFLIVKLISSTDIGKVINEKIVMASDFIFSWFMVFILIGAAVVIIVLGSLLYFGKDKTKLKED